MNCSEENTNILPFLTRFFRTVAQELVIPKGSNSKWSYKDEYKCDKNDN